MTNFKETFQNKHVVLPVIHVENEKQVISNAAIAYNAGCDGVFLINMQNPITLDRMNYQDLAKIHDLVRKEFSTWWIGVNYLDVSAISVFNILDSGISGVWVDNAEIMEWAEKQIEAEKIKEAQIASGWKGLYFGGVAFKYQPEVNNPALAAKIATAYVDVVTTSGIRTGSVPDVEKIESMKTVIGNFPLAIASGISPANVEKYLPIADCFIVASSLLQPNTENFDPKKVQDLISVVRGI